MDNFLEKLKTKNIHIVGVSGTEGSAVLEFLSKNGIKNVTAHDFSADKEELKHNFLKTHLWIKKKAERLEEFEKILKLPAKLNLKNEYLERTAEADIIFAPSSWRLYKPNFPLLPAALKKGVEFGGLTKLYFQLAKGKIISVTGTKGKGTTARLIYEILLESAKSRSVYLAGNDRRAAQELGKISAMKKDDILVLETSNRQLMDDLGRSPYIGVITNISPDHIDEHGSFENYIEAKKSLFKHSKKGDIAVLNYDNGITRRIGEELSRRKINVYFFSHKSEPENGAFVKGNKIYISDQLGSSASIGSRASKLEKSYICDLADIKLIGEHNIENVLAAALAAYLAGAKPEEMRTAIQNFRGLPHRLEFIGEHGGVKFYDDTASTNPDSTIAAIRTIYDLRFKIYDSRMVLVGGGDDKGMEYAGLAKEIIDKVGTLILLPGTGTENLRSQISPFDGLRVTLSKVEVSNLKSANQNLKIIECNNFIEALEVIKKQTKADDIVLISPACAHFQTKYIDGTGKSLKKIISEKYS